MPTRREVPIVPAVRLLTRRQVAELYAVSVDFLERVSSADLPRIKVSTRRILYDVQDVEKYFRERKIA